MKRAKKSLRIIRCSFNTMLNNNELNKISYLRREYTRGRLYKQDLPDEPIELFEYWLKQAFKSQLIDPTAMVISTVDQLKQPYQRIVLLKHYDKNGMVFFTNLNSCKANHIKNNPRVSLIFPWHQIERQIIVTGQAERFATSKVLKYFYTRPRNSQIVTWISKQSSCVSVQNELEKNFSEFKKRFLNKNIPFPTFWGGFRISIKKMEFWQGGIHRLHDRFLYQLDDKGWKVDRLAP